MKGLVAISRMVAISVFSSAKGSVPPCRPRRSHWRGAMLLTHGGNRSTGLFSLWRNFKRRLALPVGVDQLGERPAG
jgi:hypothetical protein